MKTVGITGRDNVPLHSRGSVWAPGVVAAVQPQMSQSDEEPGSAARPIGLDSADSHNVKASWESRESLNGKAAWENLWAESRRSAML